MKLTGENRQRGEKPVPVPRCPPQTPHELTRDRTRASAVRGRRLTAWAMARPLSVFIWAVKETFPSTVGAPAIEVVHWNKNIPTKKWLYVRTTSEIVKHNPNCRVTTDVFRICTSQYETHVAILNEHLQKKRVQLSLYTPWRNTSTHS
jgi:hypothetical protein